MKSYFILIILLFCMLLQSLLVKGQSGESKPAYQVSVPPSPTAAAIAKYGNIPVNLSNGLPNIDIPIYSAKGRKLSIPLSLSYHASGIRVTDVASWVGLGWSMNGIPVITRTMRGLPDESDKGYLWTAQTQGIKRHGYINPAVDYQYLQDVADGLMDTEPDAFTYNLLGSSGKFTFTESGEILTLPHQPIKFIETIADGNDRFKVIDTEGNIYMFDQSEETIPNQKGYNGLSYSSSWWLSKVISADLSDTIRLEYTEPYGYSYKTGQSQRLEYSVFLHGLPDQSHNRYEENIYYSNNSVAIMSKKLKRILFPSGKVEFFSSNERRDIIGELKLDSVVVYSKNVADSGYARFKAYKLSYGYYNEASADIDLLRLKLNSVEESGAGIKLPPYYFEYDSRPLPSRMSFSQDHWGFYNGANNWQNMIPKIRYGDSHRGTADREPNPAHVTVGILKKIFYPTGGHNELFYEANSYKGRAYTQPEGRRSIDTYAYGEGLEDEVCVDTTFVFDKKTTVSVLMTIRKIKETEFHHVQGKVTLENLTEGYTVDLLTGPISSENYVEKQFEYPLIEGQQYRLRVCATGDAINSAGHIIWYEQPPTEIDKNLLVGGVRVRKVEAYDNVTGATTNKIYKYDYPDGFSSGFRNSFPPVYQYEQEKRVGTNVSWGVGTKCETADFQLNYLTSSSASDRGDSSPITYKFVTEYDSLAGGALNGKKEYEFSIAQDYGGGGFPFSPAINQSWRRGELLTEKTYKYDAATQSYFPLQQIINEYEENSAHHLHSVYGLKVGYQRIDLGCHYSLTDGSDQEGRFFWENFIIDTRWRYLKRTKTYQFDPNDINKYIYTETNYERDNPSHAQVTRQVTTTSQGDVLTKKLKRPLDYQPASSTAIARMQELNQVSPVIEAQELLGKGGDNFVTSSQVNLHETASSNNYRVRFHAGYSLESAFPVPKADYQEIVNEEGKYASVLPDSKLKLEGTVTAYDQQYLIPLEVQSRSGVSAYRWGYHSALLIAEIKNAKSEQIYYNSFEEDPSARSDIKARSGLRCRNDFAFSPPVGFNPANESVLSYWKLVNNKWEYHEQAYNGGGFTLTGIVDDIRIHPVNAQMTTYTYTPLVGVTSVTDANNKTLYYEYDSLGRLLNIQDDSGNIVKTYEYNYSSI